MKTIAQAQVKKISSRKEVPCPLSLKFRKLLFKQHFGQVLHTISPYKTKYCLESTEKKGKRNTNLIIRRAGLVDRIKVLEPNDLILWLRSSYSFWILTTEKNIAGSSLRSQCVGRSGQRWWLNTAFRGVLIAVIYQMMITPSMELNMNYWTDVKHLNCSKI